MTRTAGASATHEHQARELRRLDLDDQTPIVEGMPTDEAVAAVRTLGPDHQRELLTRVEPGRRAAIVAALPPDERARLLGEVATPEPWLAGLDAVERELTERLLRYPPESVGRMMTPRYLELRADERCGAAVERVRHSAPEVETVYSLPVTDGDRLVGVLDLRRLLGAPDDAIVGSLVPDEAEVLSPEQDQEVAARTLLATEALAVAVTSPDGSLLGLVTIDDAMEVLQQEDSEDISMTSGTEPLDQPYMATSLYRLARSRAVWLVIAASAAALTVRVLELFEGELQQVVALALFIPLLLGTGGNIGAQAATTVVRAMAVDDVEVRDLPVVVWREVRVGSMLGGILAVLAAMPVALFYEARLAAVVSLTLVTVCAIATSVGSMLPLLVGRLGRDPAVVSAPFITTLVDATGLLVYFGFAKLIFGI